MYSGFLTLLAGNVSAPSLFLMHLEKSSHMEELEGWLARSTHEEQLCLNCIWFPEEKLTYIEVAIDSGFLP